MDKRAKKKALAEQQKRIKPGECLKYTTTRIDPAILDDRIGAQIVSALTARSVVVSTQNPPAELSITWERTTTSNMMPTSSADDDNDDDDDDDAATTTTTTTEPVLDHALLVWSVQRLCQHVVQPDDNLLHSTLAALQHSQLAGRPVTLLLHGAPPAAGHPQKPHIDRSLLRLQLRTNISHRWLGDDAAALAQTVFMFTKSVAETPYKRQMSATLNAQAFYVAADNRDCVAVRGTVGVAQLWQHQLCKMPMATLETAEAIIGAGYAMPRLLVDAYERCAADDASGGADLLLAHVPVRRAGGPLTSVRKIGPELSRRVHRLFTTDDAELVL